MADYLSIYAESCLGKVYDFLRLPNHPLALPNHHVKAKFMISYVSPTTVPHFQLERITAPCPQNLQPEREGFTRRWCYTSGMDLRVGWGIHRAPYSANKKAPFWEKCRSRFFQNFPGFLSSFLTICPLSVVQPAEQERHQLSTMLSNGKYVSKRTNLRCGKLLAPWWWAPSGVWAGRQLTHGARTFDLNH